MNQFVYPSTFTWDAESYRNNYGKMSIEPLEKGYGVTVGNALRRVLLSSIPGVAFTSVQIEGVPHEFTTIPGIREDAIDFLLNIKQVALKPVISEYPHSVRVQISGKTSINARDLVPDGSVEVLNPNLHIASLNPDTRLTMTLEITRGFGYVPSEKLRIQKKDRQIGSLLLDGIYTPVRKVTFHVENTRVGQSVDYERLNLEIWTTGAISPKDAVKEATEVLIQHFSAIGQQQAPATATAPAGTDMETPISELGLSTRVANILKSHGISTLGRLLATPRERMALLDNLGEKSIREIEEALAARGLQIPGTADSQTPEETDEA